MLAPVENEPLTPAVLRLHSSSCDKHQSGSPDMTCRDDHTAKWTQHLADSGVVIM